MKCSPTASPISLLVFSLTLQLDRQHQADDWLANQLLGSYLSIHVHVLISQQINQFTVGSHSALPSVNQSFPKVTFSQSVNLIQVSKFQCQLLDSHQFSEN